MGDLRSETSWWWFAFTKLPNLEFEVLKPLILGRIFVERPRMKIADLIRYDRSSSHPWVFPGVR
jgi:hypothetical protein